MLKKFFSAIISSVIAAFAITPLYSSHNENSHAYAAEPMSNVSISPSIEATNSIGALLASEITDAEAETEQEEASVAVKGIDLEYGSAYVSYKTNRSASMIVGLFDEASDDMIVSSTVVIAADSDCAKVTFDKMPDDYFVVRCYIVDSDSLESLSEVYENRYYTKDEQEFYAKTPDDFDSDRVLLFDENDRQNFAVYDNNTVIVPYQEGKNNVTVSEGNNTYYIIQEPTPDIIYLQNGDVLVMDTADGNQIIIKAKSVYYTGEPSGVVSIVADDDIGIDDVFSFVRIDTGYCEPEYTDDVLFEDSVVNAQTMASMKSYAADIKDDKDKDKAELSIAFNYKVDNSPKNIDKFEGTASVHVPLTEEKLIDTTTDPKKLSITGTGSNQSTSSASVSITGSLDFSITAALKFSFDKENTGKKYCSFRVDFTVSTDFKVDGTFKTSIALSRKALVVPLAHGCSLSFRPQIEVEFNAKMGVKAQMDSFFEIGYDGTRTDNKAFADKGVEIADVSGSIDGSIYIGINIHPTLALISDKILAFDVSSMGGGVLLKGKMIDLSAGLSSSDENGGDVTYTSKDERHTCISCIDGEIDLVVKIEFQVKVFSILPSNGYKNDEKPKISINIPPRFLKDFYISFGTGVNDTEFGFGTCPHRSFKCDLTVQDSFSGSVLSNASVKIKYADDIEESFTASDKGKLELFIPTGKTTATVSADKYNDTQTTFDVDKRNKDFTVKADPIKHNVVINVTDENGDPFKSSSFSDNSLYVFCSTGKEKRVISPSDDTLLKASVNGKNKDDEAQFIFDLPDGKYHFIVCRNGYDSEEFDIVVDGKEMSKDVQLKAGSPIKVVQGNAWRGYGPQYVTVYNQVKISSIGRSLGMYHSAAVSENGALYTWGKNNCGQLGNGKSDKIILDHERLEYDKNVDASSPVKIMDNIESVSLGYYHSAAITKDGDLYMWGNNSHGELGIGKSGGDHYVSDDDDSGVIAFDEGIDSDIPVKVMENVVSVSLGGFHSAALTEDGSLYMWGYNQFGQVGNGTIEDVLTPVKVLDNVESVSLGGYHSAAITKDGTLYLWGSNENGQLGYKGECLSPEKSVIKTTFSEVELGNTSSAALTQSGSLYTWGDYPDKETYTESNGLDAVHGTLKLTPEEFHYIEYYDGEPRETHINKSDILSFNMGNGATAFGWGHVGNGQSLYHSADSLACGSIITKDGKSFICGSKCVVSASDYRLKDAKAVRYFYTRTELSLENVVSSVVEYYHSAALTSDGALYMWGDNTYGQLGNGTTNGSDTPVLVEFPMEENVERYYSPFESRAKTAMFDSKLTGLEYDTLYNVYAMKSLSADVLLASDNLLYVAQRFSDEGGNVDVMDIVAKHPEAEIFAVCRHNEKTAAEDETPVIEVPSEGLKIDIPEGTEYLTAWADIAYIDEEGYITAVSDGYTSLISVKDNEIKNAAILHVTANEEQNSTTTTSSTSSSSTTTTTTSASSTTTSTTSTTTTNPTSTTTSTTTTTTSTTLTSEATTVSSTSVSTTTKIIVPPTIFGDVNNDNRLDYSDYTALTEYLKDSERYSLTNQGSSNADIYNRGDGIDEKDAVALLAWLNGDIDQLPCSGTLPGSTTTSETTSTSTTTTVTTAATTTTTVPDNSLQGRARAIIASIGTDPHEIYKYVSGNNSYKSLGTVNSYSQIEKLGWEYYAEYALNNKYVSSEYYASLTSLLFEAAGHENRIVMGTGRGTGLYYWNQVLVNGEWLNFDACNGFDGEPTDYLEKPGYETGKGYTTDAYIYHSFFTGAPTTTDIPAVTTSASTSAAETTTTTTTTTTSTAPSSGKDLGDVNEDGKIDAKDASLILVTYAKVSTGAVDGLTETQRMSADVNEDGKVDAKDASSVLAYYALVSTAAGNIPSMKEFMESKNT